MRSQFTGELMRGFRANCIILIALFLSAVLIGCAEEGAVEPEDPGEIIELETIEPEVDLPAESQIFSATQELIPLGEGKFEVSVYRVAVEDSVQGNKPVEMNSSSEHVLFVEFELLTGDRAVFETLGPLLEDSSGKTSEAVAVISGGMVRVLATLQMTGEITDFRPGKEHITWAFVSSRNAKELYLVFPDDEKIDLTPLLEEIN